MANLVRNALFAVALTLSGCASLGTGVIDAVNPLKDDKGITANVQLGKENHSDNRKQLLDVKSTTTSNVDAKEVGIIDQSTTIPWWTAVLLLFVRPMVILKETMDLFRRKPKDGNLT